MAEHTDFPRSGRRRRLLLSTAAAVLLGAGIVGAEVAGEHPLAAALAAAPVNENIQIQAPPSFADLVERVKPAVVNISTTQKIERPAQPRRLPLPRGLPEELRRFFEDQADTHPGAAEATALGSGFIIDPAGWVVTNDHVVGEADQITVVLHDGTQLPATVKGRDGKTDLALLKIESDQPLPYVRLGDDKATRVGDWVIAVGNPFGLGGSVTAGIVSATGRDINAGPYDDFLQIDAPINRGNSGGPTFNTQGEVIGINSAIYSPNGGSIGIGFAIPASLAKEVVAQLKDHGKVERGWVGIAFQPVTPDIAASLGLDKPLGALVASVDPKGPAAKAGVRQGDLILAYNGRELTEYHTLPRSVAATRAGEKATLTVLREGREMTLPVVIGSMPADERVAEAGAVEPAKLGVALADLTPELRDQLGVDEQIEGAVVRQVQPGSPAARQGIRPGDVVVSVNRQPVRSAAEAAAAVAKAKESKRDKVLLLINRDGEQRYLAVALA